MSQVVNVKTNAPTLARGEVIAKQNAAGYVRGEWVVVENQGFSGTTYLAMLCAPGVKFHEWLSHCCSGKPFASRDEAVTHILAMPGIAK